MSVAVVCNGISTNNYICKNSENQYTINTDAIHETTNLEIDESLTELNLTADTNNHYFEKDERGHCSEKWQHWFCIPNYHNRNKITDYDNPEVGTMSVGKCYTYCKDGYTPTMNKYSKCSIYDSDDGVEDDLLFNPLAIIAMFGTNLFNKTTDKVVMSGYHTIRDTIAVRGSYLNDLFRVNNNNLFITPDQQKRCIHGIEDATDGRQEKLIMRIINRFVSKGMDGDATQMSREIQNIKEDIHKASNIFIQKYVKDIKFSKKKQEGVLAKIKDYRFDTGILRGVFGKDRNGKDKFKNAISYVNIIMNFVGTTDIDNRIRQLFTMNNIKLPEKEEKSLIKIFKTACYNCFSADTNYGIFNEHLQNSVATDGDTVFYNRENTPPLLYDSGLFLEPCNIKESDLDTVSEEPKYNIPYYNNIPFYDHQLLSEYSDNEKTFIYILTVFGILLGFIAGACLIYAFLLYVLLPKATLLTKMSNYVNYCSLFYSFITISILNFSSYIYYYLLCRYSRSNYTIVSLFFKIINVIIIISLISYTINMLLNILNINYCLLSNDPTNGGVCDNSEYVYWYLVQLYLIVIYMYSMYLMRYGRTELEYDILVNVDTEPSDRTRYIDLILIEKYLTNIDSMFSVYSKDELASAVAATEENNANTKNTKSKPVAKAAKAANPEDTEIPMLPEAVGLGLPSLGTLGALGVAGVNPLQAMSQANPLSAMSQANPLQAMSQANPLTALTSPVPPMNPASLLATMNPVPKL
jgi:hypothetical protein